MTPRGARLVVVSVLLLAAPRASAQSCGVISTIGGTPLTAGDSGSGVPALDAQLESPLGVAVDGAGDVYLADWNNDVVREIVKATGQMLIVAGNGSASESGDNGPATAAGLDQPMGVCLDAAGDLFIADFEGSDIREVVKATGDIITVAGDGVFGGSGDGGPATAAELDAPETVIVDGAGNLYIADQYNYSVREVSKATGIISTIAGDGTAGYSGDGGPAASAQMDRPVGLALDAAGDLYIADYGNDAVRFVDKATGVITTVAGTGVSGYSGDNGPAADAQLAQPQDLALDFDGDLYIADYNNSVIREIPAGGGPIVTMAGTPLSPGFSGDGGPATSAQLDEPFGVCADGYGDVYIGDQGNEVIREVACVDGPVSPTITPTPTLSPTFTASPTVSPTETVSPTPSGTPTRPPSPTVSPTPSVTSTPPPSLLLTPHYPDPDPAGPSGVWLPYTINTSAYVSVTIYDVSGEEVRRWGPDPDFESAGDHERLWDEANSWGRSAASGVYLVLIQARSPAGDSQEAWEKCAVIR